MALKSAILFGICLAIGTRLVAVLWLHFTFNCHFICPSFKQIASRRIHHIHRVVCNSLCASFSKYLLQWLFSRLNLLLLAAIASSDCNFFCSFNMRFVLARLSKRETRLYDLIMIWRIKNVNKCQRFSRSSFYLVLGCAVLFEMKL